MAAGRPVIGSEVGGIPHQIRHGETGFVVPPGRPDLLARRMVELLQNGELCRRMGEKARGEARNRFSIESVARQTMAVYREIVPGSAD
jgi:glycosyltransferase involved in cell wall biosynthesis